MVKPHEQFCCQLTHSPLLFHPNRFVKAEERFHMQYAPALLGTAPSAHLRSFPIIAPDGVAITDQLLGHGQYGSVWLGRLQPAATFVAVKMVADASNGRHLTQLLLEARLQARLAHPNLVRLLAVQEMRLPVMLCFEYCTRGDLRQYLRAQVESPSELAFRDMAAQVAAAVQYLHSNLCVHRDLAARNVLLTDAARTMPSPPCGYLLKLTDLGLARPLQPETEYYRVSRYVCI